MASRCQTLERHAADPVAAFTLLAPGNHLRSGSGLIPFLFLLICVGASLTTGCAHKSTPPPSPRPFVFERDTFAFSNQTFWVYRQDPATGRMTHEDRQPRPDFAHRCFVVVRAAREFHLHARFHPDAAPLDAAGYRDAVRRVVARSDWRESPVDGRVVIPGYAGLREFSREHENILKDEMGGAWQSYAQRGHWRMIMPFSRRHQERVAEDLARRLPGGSPIAVHVVCFPALSINHALILFAVESSSEAHRFVAYDPNNSSQPIHLEFDRRTRRFELPPTPYFVGGHLDVYEVYRSAWY